MSSRSLLKHKLEQILQVPPAKDSEEASGTQESEDGNGRNRKTVVNSREDLVKFASDVLKTNISGFNVIGSFSAKNSIKKV